LPALLITKLPLGVGVWNSSRVARDVTQIRFRGMAPNSIVHADAQTPFNYHPFAGQPKRLVLGQIVSDLSAMSSKILTVAEPDAMPIINNIAANTTRAFMRNPLLPS
jgi:hypothetical protein